MINQHVTSWLGLPVKDFTEDMAKDPITDGASVIYRLRREWESELSLEDLFAAFITNESTKDAHGIIFGAWSGNDPEATSVLIVTLLVEARNHFRGLRGIFIGDILSEENEISWIQQSDVSPLFSAYPKLESLRVRGSSELSLGSGLRHESLRTLTVESGGLPGQVLREILSLDLPELEELEIWLGTDDYGGDSTAEDLAPLLTGDLFPSLKKLGLRDSDRVNEIAKELKTASVLDQITDLDLSLGTLTDEGAEHLLQCAPLQRLKSLDLHHHYCSAAMMARLRAFFPSVNLGDKQDLDQYGPYVAVGE